MEMLESISRKTKGLIDEQMVNARLESLEHHRKFASLAVLYEILFGIIIIVSAIPLHYRSTRRAGPHHQYTVDITLLCRKCFVTTFIMRTAQLPQV